jgi:hypothetical protein
VVEADRSDRVEVRQVVAARRKVAVPGDHVERAVVERGGPQLAAIFLESARWARPGPRTRRPGSRSRAGWRGRWRRSGQGRAGGRARRNFRRGSRGPCRRAARS